MGLTLSHRLADLSGGVPTHPSCRKGRASRLRREVRRPVEDHVGEGEEEVQSGGGTHSNSIKIKYGIWNYLDHFVTVPLAFVLFIRPKLTACTYYALIICQSHGTDG